MAFKKGSISWNKGLKKEYKFSEETRKRMSEAQKGHLVSKEVRQRLREYHLGRKHSEETKRKIGLAGKGRSPSKKSIQRLIDYNKTRVITQELRKKFGNAMRGKHHSEEMKRKMSEKRKGLGLGKDNPMFGKKHSEETKGKIREATLNLYEKGILGKSINTNIEKKIKEELIKRGFRENKDFIHQFKFNNKFMCDFCFPKSKVILEAYGDFWHCNPSRFKEVKYPQQKKALKQDKSKEAYIKKFDNYSWKYLVLWESDIIKNVKKCVDEIEDIIKT